MRYTPLPMSAILKALLVACALAFASAGTAWGHGVAHEHGTAAYVSQPYEHEVVNSTRSDTVRAAFGNVDHLAAAPHCPDGPLGACCCTHAHCVSTTLVLAPPRWHVTLAQGFPAETPLTPREPPSLAGTLLTCAPPRAPPLPALP